MASDFSTNQFVSTNTCSSAANFSRWLTEEVFKLIDIVQRDEAIYNPRHKYYFCRPYVENFWREVDLKLEKNPGASLAKWTNLRISFRREYTNYLEEKVPPCWSYFDRMFFLHPYLRKKHQQPKSLGTQVQDALAHLSNLSNRMQRERAVTTCTAASTTTTAQVNTGSTAHSAQPSPQPPQLDNYLDYFDEHDHNNSELDEIIDEEQRARFQNHPLDNNDIKSECEEPVEDYEPEAEADAEQRFHHAHQDEEEHDRDDDHEMRPNIYDTAVSASAPISSTSSSSSLALEKRFPQHYQQHNNSSRLQHMNRLQMRTYHHEETRALRSRSQELQGVAAAAATVAAASAANMQTHSNVSFVRPTFSSKPVDMVSTTTHSSTAVAVIGGTDSELPTPSSVAAAATPSSAYVNQRHLHGSHSHSHHQSTPAQRLEVSNGAASAAGAVELCDCKTDSDAMFLMSLLPDIQKLNGRDRGKIKIAFQNILQDYLYPD
ncbi:LOW QUALITY PROTEIN: uncharacterized protein LOC133837104 [Drosophila sulfurigaster albostrigata]|uniref:LOW QUALITY PROTEIN: uncharacterized protein LOC133837104 n=1 Tax=Drosophila sulfurigaster albostrigata TaxID=89887 RepID=UPI002D21AD4E|nr:LOW QUALITY PROTEIN: uncharacterized protein LOC133837104 [Drosophila sulfurigaster albostrigata]